MYFVYEEAAQLTQTMEKGKVLYGEVACRLL